MGKLIDADTLSDHKFQEGEFHDGSLNAAYRQGWNDAIDAIVENAPPVDAVPVRRGHWVKWFEQIYDSFGVAFAPHCKCSECNIEYDSYNANRMNFCPNCGARMDGKGDGNEGNSIYYH